MLELGCGVRGRWLSEGDGVRKEWEREVWGECGWWSEGGVG